ncbi:MAG: pyridoxamine 5'-phosphate oxidase family protein [Myxococcota bacterium]
MNESLRTVVATLRSSDVAMFVTARDAAPPSARPMQIGEVEDDGTLWFVSTLASSMVDALHADPHVAVVCQRPDAFISVSGVAEIYQFPAKLREIWRPSFDRWLPKGPETPDAVAVRVAPVSGDHWDAAGHHAHFGPT